MKGNQKSDLGTDAYTPLDNNHSTTDLLDHHRPRTESGLFNQFINRPPTNVDIAGQQQQLVPSVSVRRNIEQPWREVNGDWRHTRNPLNSNDPSNHGEPLWYDNDQMDVHLLNSAMVIFILLLFFILCLTFFSCISIGFRPSFWKRTGSMGSLSSAISSF